MKLVPILNFYTVIRGYINIKQYRIVVKSIGFGSRLEFQAPSLTKLCDL